MADPLDYEAARKWADELIDFADEQKRNPEGSMVNVARVLVDAMDRAKFMEADRDSQQRVCADMMRERDESRAFIKSLTGHSHKLHPLQTVCHCFQCQAERFLAATEASDGRST